MTKLSFEFEVRELLSLPQAAYDDVDIVDNPFHFFTSSYVSDCNGRERLMARILEMSEEEPFIYLTGHMFGGSGKTHLLLKAFDYWAEDETVVVVKLTDIVGFRFPPSIVDIVGKEVLRFFEGAEHVTKIVILDEVEFPELYELCLQCSNHVLAGGHYLTRDAGQFSNKFQEIDLDSDWPLGQMEIFEHLTRKLELSQGNAAIPSSIVELAVKVTENIGQAEMLLGLLLATYVRRVMIGKCPTVTSGDVSFWLSAIGTNWFWFSMDCWRIKDPIAVNILHSNRGQKSQLVLEISVRTSIGSRQEGP